MSSPKKPCKNQCTTTSLNGDVICRGCGLTDEEKRDWGTYSDRRRVIVTTVCEYRVKHYDIAVHAYLAALKKSKDKQVQDIMDLDAAGETKVFEDY